MLTGSSSYQNKSLPINNEVMMIEQAKDEIFKFFQPIQESFKSHLQTSQSDNQSMDFQIGPSSFPSHNVTVTSQRNSIIPMMSLGLQIIFNKTKKCLKKLSFDMIKSNFLNRQETKKMQADYDLFLSTEQNLSELIEKTLSEGKRLQPDNKNISNSNQVKQLHRRIFYLESKNALLQQEINTLKNQIEEFQKRLSKQAEKKRDSLETFADQIRQKNQYIFELKNSIKKYQKYLGINHQTLSVQNVLIEDQHQLQNNCLRLQNINQKLNNDLRNSQNQIHSLNNQLFQLRKTILILKNQNNDLKQRNFDLHHSIQKNQQLGHVYSNFCKRLNNKISNLKLQQKKSQNQIKLSRKTSLQSFPDLFSSKNTETSLSSLPLSRKSSLKDFEVELKIQEIFSFIFNIHQENYQLNNEELFDQDQIKLLNSHKKYFFINTHNQNPQISHLQQTTSKKQQRNLQNDIYYLQADKKSILIQNSFLNALDPKTQTCFRPNKNLEIENSRLIQKISELKNMHMHIRDLVLKFLKTMDFSNLRSDASAFLQVIFDLFQYSEDQKALLCKEKKKKFWGII